MKKILIFVLCLMPFALMGQSDNVRNVVSGTNLKSYRGQTLLNPNLQGIFNVLDYGAKPDSTTDCTAAFRLTSAAAGLYGTVYIPDGPYILTDSVQFKGNIDGDKARIYVSDVTKAGYFVCGDWTKYTSSKTYRLPRFYQRSHVLTGGWGTDVAVKLVNLNGSMVYMTYAEDFGVGLECVGAATSFVFNHIFIGKIYNCKVGIKCSVSASGWVNDNAFYGGEILSRSAEGTNVAGHYKVLLNDGYWGPSENVFYKVGMEGDVAEHAAVIYGKNNVFFNCRFEGTTPTVLFGKYRSGTVESGGNQFIGNSAVHSIVFSGDALSISLTRITSANKNVFTAYTTNPILNISSRESNSSPVFSIWPMQWNTTTTLTTWGLQLGQELSKFKSTADTYPRFQITNNTGILSFGSGAAATDVSLNRVAVGQLQISGALNYILDNSGGGNDTYTATIVGTFEYIVGKVITFHPLTLNTGACTLNINDGGAIAIKTQANGDPANSDMVATGYYPLCWNGANWVLMTK